MSEEKNYFFDFLIKHKKIIILLILIIGVIISYIIIFDSIGVTDVSVIKINEKTTFYDGDVVNSEYFILNFTANRIGSSHPVSGIAYYYDKNNDLIGSIQFFNTRPFVHNSINLLIPEDDVNKIESFKFQFDNDLYNLQGVTINNFTELNINTTADTMWSYNGALGNLQSSDGVNSMSNPNSVHRMGVEIEYK